MEQAPKILITRLSHIGDCVLTLPLARALKQRWPSCEIHWAMESPTGKLLGDHSDIDRVISVPKSYLTKPTEVWKLRNLLKKEKFDIVFDPQSLTKSSFLGWLTGAKTRVGMGGKWKKELSGWFNTEQVRPSSSHLADRTVQLLEGLETKNSLWKSTPVKEVTWNSNANFAGAIDSQQNWFKAEGCTESEPKGNCVYFPNGELEFSIPTTAADQQWVEGVLEEEDLSSSNRKPEFGIINPGASWESKRWVNGRYSEVANQLFGETGFRWLVTWAGDEELAMAKEIVEASPEACRIAPSSSLKQWTQLAKDATMFLGCDTGPMHMAAAVGTPCVVLFGPTKSHNSGPYGKGHACIQVEYQSGGAKERRAAKNIAMAKISARTVFSACFQLLEETRRHGRFVAA